MSSAKRILNFFWGAGTRGVAGVNETAAQSAVEAALVKKAASFPELANASKASVEYGVYLDMIWFRIQLTVVGLL